MVAQTPGNPAYLAPLAQKVRQAEMDVLFAVNFAVDIRYCSPGKGWGLIHWFAHSVTDQSRQAGLQLQHTAAMLRTPAKLWQAYEKLCFLVVLLGSFAQLGIQQSRLTYDGWRIRPASVCTAIACNRT